MWKVESNKLDGSSVLVPKFRPRDTTAHWCHAGIGIAWELVWKRCWIPGRGAELEALAGVLLLVFSRVSQVSSLHTQAWERPTSANPSRAKPALSLVGDYQCDSKTYLGLNSPHKAGAPPSLFPLPLLPVGVNVYFWLSMSGVDVSWVNEFGVTYKEKDTKNH